MSITLAISVTGIDTEEGVTRAVFGSALSGTVVLVTHVSGGAGVSSGTVGLG